MKKAHIMCFHVLIMSEGGNNEADAEEILDQDREKAGLRQRVRSSDRGGGSCNKFCTRLIDHGTKSNS
jgi:hypothetical protein